MRSGRARGGAELKDMASSNSTLKKREKFLKALAEGDSATGAAEKAGLGRRTVYTWRKEDEDFEREWDAAIEAGTDILEDEAKKRAVEGSDTLLMFLLNGRRPEKYRPKTQISGVINHNHSHSVAVSETDRLLSGIAQRPEAGTLTEPTTH